MGLGTPLKKTTIQPGGILVGEGIRAGLTTAIAGTNNDLVFTARGRTTVGNATSIAYVVAGANTPLSISVTGQAITVNVATNGSSAATSTAAQVTAALLADLGANALLNSVANAASNDGTGVVAALSTTLFTGGQNYVRGPRTGGIGPSSDRINPVKRSI